MSTITTTSNQCLSALESIVKDQLTSLDDTDAYASVWKDTLSNKSSSGKTLWGGRGRGGRGVARRTIQPRDIVVDCVTLEYVGGGSAAHQQLLSNATLKLLAGRRYALIGRNGVGKSTLLRRIHSGRIPGFPTHVATLYLPQEILPPGCEEGGQTPTAVSVVLQYYHKYAQTAHTRLKHELEAKENKLENLDEAMHDDYEERMEEICGQISDLQDELEEAIDEDRLQQLARDALAFFGLDESQSPYERLSAGQRKKVALAVAVLCVACHREMDSTQQLLLCIDEPTNSLDVAGLIQLRRFLIQATSGETENDREAAEDGGNCSNTSKNQATVTILLVSHDLDLLNDVATDIIYFSQVQKTLHSHPGNYADYIKVRDQFELHTLRQQVGLDKKRASKIQTIHLLQQQPTPKRGGAKKKAKQIAVQQHQLRRMGVDKNAKGHRWTQQGAGTAIKSGSINGIDASTRKDLSTAELLQLAEASVRPPPEKTIQFVFRNNTSVWGEPLISATDVGHGYDVVMNSSNLPSTGSVIGNRETSDDWLIKKDGFLFDCVDLCINEGHTYCIMGSNGCGKSVLLRLLAKQEEPMEGQIKHASNLQIGFLSQTVFDDLILSVDQKEKDNEMASLTALSFLSKRFPQKDESELRAELTNFGLCSPKQVTGTDIRFFSGGERVRLCLAQIMLHNPHILVLDNPTSHLDIESVDALIHGILNWNGTVLMVSHDTYLIRSLNAECAVLMEEEGKVRRIAGTIDEYLRSFKDC